jgi:hypothetical protein
MISNDLSEIYFALKYYHDKNLPLHEKIASISRISKNLCHNFFMTSLNEIVKVFKEVTIKHVISLNIYENPPISCTLFVLKNGILKPWLNLKFSSIKNSGLGFFFHHKVSRRTNSYILLLFKNVFWLKIVNVL